MKGGGQTSFEVSSSVQWDTKMCGFLLYTVEGGPYKEYSVYIKQIKERHHNKTLVRGKIR